MKKMIDLFGSLIYKIYKLTWDEENVVDPEFENSKEEFEATGVKQNA